MKFNHKLLLGIMCSALSMQSYSGAALAVGFEAADVVGRALAGSHHSHHHKPQRSFLGRCAPFLLVTAAGGTLLMHREMGKRNTFNKDIKILEEIRDDAMFANPIDHSRIDGLTSLSDHEKNNLKSFLGKYNEARPDIKSGAESKMAHEGQTGDIPAIVPVVATCLVLTMGRENVQCLSTEAINLLQAAHHNIETARVKKNNISWARLLKKAKPAASKAKSSATAHAHAAKTWWKTLSKQDQYIYGGAAGCVALAGVWSILRK